MVLEPLLLLPVSFAASASSTNKRKVPDPQHKIKNAKIIQNPTIFLFQINSPLHNYGVG